MAEYDVSKEAKHYSIFKGKSAIRFRLVKPQVVEEGTNKKLNAGFVFLEAAPVKDDNAKNKTYQWENKKIGIKLGMPDLQKLGYAIERGLDVDLFHEFNGNTKTIGLKRSTGGASPYFLSVAQNVDGEKSSLSTPLSVDETFALSVLIKHSIPSILNW